MSFNVGENVGPYRIIEQLGQGGMATVFKAYHAALDRYVALKVLHPAFLEDPNFLARFQREARVVAKLDHPNIVPIYDYAEHGGRPYLVMKFIEGATLKATFASGLMTPERILQIVEAVGAGLSFAHQRGILHRDIKPSNVLISKDGQIYLADFGLARIAQSGASTMTSDSILGTPQYISPEQALGKKDLDEGTDIYSFGVMLYELTVGKVPFSADTPFSVIHDHIYSPLPMPRTVNPTVSEDLERVLLKALAKERLDRYKDVSTMVDAFVHAWKKAPPPMPLEVETTLKIEPPSPESPAPSEVPYAGEKTIQAEYPVLDPAAQEEQPPAGEEILEEEQPGLVPAVVVERATYVVEAAQDEPLTLAPPAEAEILPELEGIPAEEQPPAAPIALTEVPLVEPEVAQEEPGVPEELPRPFQTPPTPRIRKRPMWVWSVIAGVLILACVVGLLGWRGLQRRRYNTIATQTAQVLVPLRTPTPKPISTNPPSTNPTSAVSPAYPEGVLFQANFDNGRVPVGWYSTDDAWSVKDNTMLCGSGHSFAGVATGKDWKNYAVKFRLMLDRGTINLNLRQSAAASGLDRYFVTVEKAGLVMNKQTGLTFRENLTELDYFFPPGTWMDVTLVAQGNRIMMMVNGVNVIDHTDNANPLGIGTFTVETLDDSNACVDDVVVLDLAGNPPYDLVYEQHFDNAAVVSDWNITNAEGKPNESWKITDGALCGNWHNWAIPKTPLLSDFTMNYRLTMKSGSTHLNFRTGDNNRYYIFIDTVDPVIILKKDTKAFPGQELARGSMEFLPNQWNMLVLRILGGHVQLWVNNKIALDFTDQAPLKAGAVGFESLDAQEICVDDMVITLPSQVKNP